MADQFLRKVRNQEVTLGVMELLSSPEVTKTLAATGMDFVCVDQMFTSIDWDRTAHIVRAAQAAGISPMVRIEANPWVTKGQTKQVATECQRAQAIGASSIMASVYGPEEVEALIQTTKDWHRDIHVFRHLEDMSRSDRDDQEIAEGTLLLPLLEAQREFSQYEEIISVDGLEAVLLGLTDLTRVFGFPYEYEHPQLWELVDRVVDLCRGKGIVVAGNTGYAFQTIDANAQRIKRMVDHGITMIIMQSDATLLQYFARDVVAATHSLLEANS